MASVGIISVFLACGVLACTTDPPRFVSQESVSIMAPALEKAPIKTVARNRRTLFERFENRRKCGTKPSLCDAELFDMEIKKSVEKELDPDANLSTEFCLGGCSDKRVLQWSLEWM